MDLYITFTTVYRERGLSFEELDTKTKNLLTSYLQEASKGGVSYADTIFSRIKCKGEKSRKQTVAVIMILFSDSLIESGVLKKHPHIVLLSFISTGVYNDVKHAIEPESKNPELSGVFFVSYANLDIPKGETFQKIFNPATKEAEDVVCTLANITQQFGKPFDYIPAGWKTICRINFSKKNAGID